jgi:uroporphyrinogen decarboxylase
MNLLEKFNKTMNFEKSQPPRWEFGYWAQTIKRWVDEGLSLYEAGSGITEIPGGLGVGAFFHIAAYDSFQSSEINDYFKLDDPVYYLPIEYWLLPKYKKETVEERSDGRKVIRDSNGILSLTSSNEDSIPQFLKFPVENDEDWENIKATKLNPKEKGRYPDDLKERIEKLQSRTVPFELGGYPIGFFGAIRNLMGEVNLFTGYYDNPNLIHTIIEYLTQFWIDIFSPILDQITPDYFRMWEDMCYKNGPLISPELFREFLLPAYKKFTGFLKEKGVKTILVDTDGNCWKLIPLFLEGGVTGIYPMEVAAGMDVVEVRKQYPSLQILGGIDKMPIISSIEDIDYELNLKIPFMLKAGGYIPFIDHFIPPDISFDNFAYYRNSLNKMISDF